MPNRFLDAGPSAGVPQPPVGNRFLTGAATPGAEDGLPVEPIEDSGSWLPVMAGAGALAGVGALAAKMPGSVGKAARGLNALRQQLMLSGLALPKSLLGNAGAAITTSLEHGSLKPLTEMFSGQTVRDAAAAFKRGPQAGAQTGQAVNLPKVLSLPGRLMGAFDEAAQAALVRGGSTAEEATNAVLQTPLGKNFGPMGEIMESPVASYLQPFRRTPFNQFIEGYKTMATPAFKGTLQSAGSKRALAATAATGAVHGAATADDKAPLSVPLAMSAAGRYGMPYAIAALLARGAMGGKNASNIAGSALPVSEYGFEQSLNDPLKPFREPAAFSALRRITGP